MPRISGVDIPNEKPIKVSLTYVYGIGKNTALKLLKSANIDPNLRANKLTGTQIQSLVSLLDKTPVEGDLRKIVRDNIQRLKRIGSYRGMRHIAGLPTRGQRTRTNGRSSRGKRKTVGAMTKEMRQKLEDAK
jgi:small subunit ribosomal protein S13